MTEYYKLEDFLGVVVVVVDFLSCCNRCLFGFFKKGGENENRGSWNKLSHLYL